MINDIRTWCGTVQSTSDIQMTCFVAICWINVAWRVVTDATIRYSFRTTTPPDGLPSSLTDNQLSV